MARVAALLVMLATSALLAQPPAAPRQQLVGDSLIYPRAADATTSTPALSFYVSVRPAAERPQVTARVAVARARQTVAEMPLSLDAPARDGTIRQVTRLNVESSSAATGRSSLPLPTAPRR
jgi:hypothetical protein